ncbi:hypothetical protein HDV57DRAFT_504435 [Trichoderma longibrachiatum]
MTSFVFPVLVTLTQAYHTQGLFHLLAALFPSCPRCPSRRHWSYYYHHPCTLCTGQNEHEQKQQASLWRNGAPACDFFDNRCTRIDARIP